MPSQLLLPLQFPDAIRFESFYDKEDGVILTSLKKTLSAGNGSLYLYGNSGSGRTHLLQAACSQLMLQGKSAIYLPLKDAKQLSPDYIENFETLSLIAIDDIYAIAGHLAWEQALLKLYNTSQETASTILLISSNAQPYQLGFSVEELVTRLTWSPMISLTTLSSEEKLNALQHSAAARGLELSREVALFLLNRLPDNMHALFKGLNQLDRASLQTQRRLTIPFVKQTLNF